MVKELLAYQEEDALLRAIEQELQGSEERKKMAQARKFLEGVDENLAALDKKAKDLAGLYESISAKHKELGETLKEIAGAVEGCEDENAASYLQKKTEELLGRMNALQAQASALTEDINAVLRSYQKLKANTKAMQAQYKEFKVKYDELKTGREEERKAIESKLAALEKSVDGALMEKYKAKRKDKMFPILFEAKGEKSNMCGKCLMEISMADVNKLKGGEVIECDNCRCLIYKKD